MAVVKKLSENFFEGVEWSFKSPGHRDRRQEKLRTLIPLMLNGYSYLDCADETNMSFEVCRYTIFESRPFLGLRSRNYRDWVRVAFDKGVDAEISQRDIDRCLRISLKDAFTMEMKSNGGSNKDMAGAAGTTNLVKYMSYLEQLSLSLLEEDYVHQKSLLPATTFRAVSIYLRRQNGDTSYFPNSQVRLG